ncbi:protein FATTY ACID EXPORT 2, chloroplastic-like [Aristolochia californica]|uniref:protein FATTY ACID EXPORT 2, chloroplastic-like n=1 Tax=Aristolochia californica TaxID=171875 RepID=UPI0035DF6BEE
MAPALCTVSQSSLLVVQPSNQCRPERVLSVLNLSTPTRFYGHRNASLTCTSIRPSVSTALGDRGWRSSIRAVSDVDSERQVGEWVKEIELGGGGGGGGDDDNNNKGNGGGGGENNGDGEGEPEKKKKMSMSMSQKLTLGYAALVGVGGVMGYLKSGSQKSLAAGGLSALLLVSVYNELPVRPILASSVGLGLSAALLAVMGSRFKRSRKLFPAGIVSIASFIMAGGYLHGFLRSLSG